MRGTTIRRRLMLLACLPPAAALVLIACGAMTYEYASMRATQVQSLESLARLLAANSRGVMAFEDAAAGEELLASLAQEPAVTGAVLFSADGRPLAEYRIRAAAEGLALPSKVEFTGTRSPRISELELMHPIRDEGALAGYLYVQATLDRFWTGLLDFVKIIGCLAVAALIVVAVLANRLQKGITTPIVALTTAASRITNEHNFSIRVGDQADAELGHLQAAFNCLLEHVERSEQALQESNDLLEQRVAERTSQLSQEIARRAQTQRELELACEAAEAASKAKSEFLANMSHEIRTPMTAILGFADMLMEDGDLLRAPPRRVEAIRTIQRNGEHLLSIINDILDLSKVEAGKMTFERIATSPLQVVGDVLSLMQVRATAKQLSLEVIWDGPIPETIQSDPTRLRQVLVNLIGNAIKFTEAGGVTLRVGLAADDPANPLLRFVVRDTGIGMTQAQLDTIFAEFAQADTSMTRRFGGTGLGLAISRRFTEMLGGRISVTSKPSEGSTFTFTVATGPLEGVPLIHASQELLVESPVDAQAEETLNLDAKPLAGGRVLLAEDGLDNQRLIALILQRAGAMVSVVDNGRKAVEKFTVDGSLDGALSPNPPYDLLLLDMQMPEMDGYTAAGILRALGNRVPVVALTAHALQSEREKCLAAGCDDYMTKPVDRVALVKCVAFWLRKNRPPATVAADVATKPRRNRRVKKGRA